MPILPRAASLFLLLPAAAFAQSTPHPTSTTAPAASDGSVQAALVAARDRVLPALVNISTVSVSYWGGQESKVAGTGSGTIISPDGLVVTNAHVTDNGRSFRVTLSDRREASATLVGEDPMTDLAVLRINREELGDAPLPHASFGDSSTLNVGDAVLAMGSPFSLSRSVTLGIVSNTERVFTGPGDDDIADQAFDFDQGGEIFTRWIHHDALINPGNSGGPLVNMRGEIIGVNARGGAGMGFAIPADLARRVTSELIAHGKVTRSTLGVALKSVRRAGLDSGVLVNSVDADGPAARAGIQAGDVIVALDDRAIAAVFPEEIPVIARDIAERPVGSIVRVTFRRGSETRTAEVTTAELLGGRRREAALRTWGLSASEITERMQRSRRLPSRDGAFVIGVRGGGPAATAEPAFQPGDIILSIDNQPITSLEALVDRYRAISSSTPLPEFVTLTFDRNGKNNITLIKPRPPKVDDPPRELPRAWIGVATQPVLRDLARQIGLGDTTGFRVTRVYPGTLAQQAGVQVGDVITAINGDALSPRTMQDMGMFQRRVRQLRAGETATLSVIRGSAPTTPTTLTVTLERTRLAPDEALRDQNRDFGLSVRELTFFDQDDNRWDENTKGVVVTDVDPAGWAGMAGIMPGDLIQRVGETTVTDLPGYRAAMAAVSAQQPARVTFVLLRGTRTQFVFAEPDWKPIVTEEGAKR